MDNGVNCPCLFVYYQLPLTSSRSILSISIFLINSVVYIGAILSYREIDWNLLAQPP